MPDLGVAAGQFVTFGIERERFAIPVATVVEILELREMFRVPEGPPYLAGLIDVRGRSVPVIDLRVKLGMAAIPPSESTRIMVLEVDAGMATGAPAGATRRLVLGLIADRVFEVAPLDGGRLEPPPDIGSGWHSNALLGVGRRGDAIVVVLNLAGLLAADGELLQSPADERQPASDDPRLAMLMPT